MKMRSSMILASMALTGCNSLPAINWQQDSQVNMHQVTIELKSHLWLNAMPVIDDPHPSRVHGSLTLESLQTLPAVLTVASLVIKQSHNKWSVPENRLELRSHNQHQWEVVVDFPENINVTAPVDIALRLDHAHQQSWLVEKQVQIEQVY